MEKFILISAPELITLIHEAIKAEVEKIIPAQKPQSETEYITRKETAQILGISLPTLHDWSKTGIIPSYRISTRVRYKKSDIEASLGKVESFKYGRNQ